RDLGLMTTESSLKLLRRVEPGVSAADDQDLAHRMRLLAGLRPIYRERGGGFRRPAAPGSAHSHRSGDHRQSSSARSPIGLSPDPAASAWPARACRHLTRSGMPPAENPAISPTNSTASRSAR